MDSTPPGSTPVPDPTVLTTQQLAAAIDGLRAYTDGQIAVLEQRLTGMDRATQLLDSAVNRVPTMLQLEISHITAVMSERFESVKLQFELVERQRLEQKADTKAAVDAALTAQKEAVKEQTTASERAIAKSEAATTKQLEQLNATFTTAINGVSNLLSDLKERLGKIENVRIGQQETTRATQSNLGALAAAATVLVAAVAIVTFVLARG